MYKAPGLIHSTFCPPPKKGRLKRDQGSTAGRNPGGRPVINLVTPENLDRRQQHPPLQVRLVVMRFSPEPYVVAPSLKDSSGRGDGIDCGDRGGKLYPRPHIQPSGLCLNSHHRELKETEAQQAHLRTSEEESMQR